MNAFAELTLAVYLLAVLANKNETQLFNKLKQETGFLKWAISLGIVSVVSYKFGKAGEMFIRLVFVAMALTAIRKNPEVFNNITEILRG